MYKLHFSLVATSYTLRIFLIQDGDPAMFFLNFISDIRTGSCDTSFMFFGVQETVSDISLDICSIIYHSYL